MAISLTLASEPGEFIAATKSAQGSGAFTFSPVLPGTYKLFVIASGFREKIVPVDADGGKDVTLGTVVLELGWLEGNPPDFLQYLIEPTSTPADPTVCQILKDPMRFHRKIVRVRAEAGTGIDTPPAISDPNCSGKILLSLPTTGSIVNDESYRIFESHLRSWLQGPVQVTIEGEFKYVLRLSEPNLMYLHVARVSDVIAPPARVDNTRQE